MVDLGVVPEENDQKGSTNLGESGGLPMDSPYEALAEQFRTLFRAANTNFAETGYERKERKLGNRKTLQ